MKRQERIQRVAEMLSADPTQSNAALAKSLGVSASTIRADKNAIREQVGEMVNRNAAVLPSANLWSAYSLTVDRTQVNYEFWDKLRRGMAKGYELGGLFARPIAEIISGWTYGSGPDVEIEGDEYASTAATEFLSEYHDEIASHDFDGISLGDSYLVVNPDATLTAAPANQVDVVTDDLDFRKVVAVKIKTILEKASIIDEYRIDGRTITIRLEGSTEPQVFNYRNLIGMIPVNHHANDRSANEVYGHPVYEALLHLFAEYDDVLKKSLKGVKVMGQPIPVAENLEEPEDAMKLNASGEEKWRDEFGVEQTRYRIDFGRLSMLFLGKGGKFHFASPGAFTQDAGRLLEFLFLLMMEHSKIPEWAWGGAIASSKASVDAQMPAFEIFINARRRRVEKYLKPLIQMWLATKALTDPRLASAAEKKITIKWPSLTNDSAEVMQKWVQMLLDRGYITPVTAVTASGLVEDAQKEVDQAEEIAAKKREEMEAMVEGRIGQQSQRFNQQQQQQQLEEAA